jgi:hypothetical protein
VAKLNYVAIKMLRSLTQIKGSEMKTRQRTSKGATVPAALQNYSETSVRHHVSFAARFLLRHDRRWQRNKVHLGPFPAFYPREAGRVPTVPQ